MSEYKSYDPIENGITLPFEKHPLGNGFQTLIKLSSGRSISIIQHEISYGSDRGLYEMAVVRKDGELIEKPVKGWGSENVRGHMMESEVTSEIKRLSLIY